MLFGGRDVDGGFERLQSLLLAMRAGDSLSLGEAVQASGLSESTCRDALRALTRVGLLSTEAEGRFTRLTLRPLVR
ncbi:MAG: hypothetical protein AB7O32_09085 [Vicinamibacterales bacterium]